MNNFEAPERLPQAAEVALLELTQYWSLGPKPPEHWFTTLTDEPRTGKIREAVKQAAANISR